MKKILHIAWMSAVLAWSAAGAAAQQRPIQPSPAYTQGGTVYYPAAPRPAASPPTSGASRTSSVDAMAQIATSSESAASSSG